MRRNLVAILRGIRPSQAHAACATLIEAGIGVIEVPLNSPSPLRSIEIMASGFDSEALVGAGTVLSPEAVRGVASAGGKIVVSPNVNTSVVAAAKELGMSTWPGAMTPTECLMALSAGSDGVKVFPGLMVRPDGLRAIRAILPDDAKIMAVGGVGPGEFSDWLAAGADGFGIGSSLYKPGMTLDELKRNALSLVASYDLALEESEGLPRGAFCD